MENGKSYNVLVCITAQHNSKRLINEGERKAKECGGTLHIINVQKGDNIFISKETPRLLQMLFSFGAEVGGEIHALCSDNIPLTIKEFIERKKITHMVLGEAPGGACNNNVFNEIINMLPESVEVFVVPRTR